MDAAVTAASADFFVSDDFRRRMKRVGSKSVPFGSSTPSSVVYERLAEAYRASEEDAEGRGA